MSTYSVSYDDVFDSFVVDWAAKSGSGAVANMKALYDFCEDLRENPLRIMKHWGFGSRGQQLYVGRYSGPGARSLCISAAIDVNAAKVVFVALSAELEGNSWDLAGKLAYRNISE